MKFGKAVAMSSIVLLGINGTALPVMAITEDEFINELYGEQATKNDIVKKEEEHLATTHNGDFITGEITGIVIEGNKARVIENGELKEIPLEELKSKNIKIYHTADGLYEKADIHRTSQQKEKEIVIATYNQGNVNKTDKDTEEIVKDATFGLFVSTKEGKWTREATLKPTDTEDNCEIKRVIKTQEYNIKEWVSNYDNLSPEDKEKYKDMPKEEPVDKEDKKTEEELTQELEKIEQEVRDGANKWLIIEDEVKNGYLRSTTTWNGEVKNGKIEIPEINLIEQKITGEEKDTVETKLNTTIKVNLTAKDTITRDKISGGEYDIYISYVNSPDDSKKVGTAKFVNGKLTGEYKIESSKVATYESDPIMYVKEYGKLPNYARKLYSDSAKSRKQARSLAKKNAQEKADKARVGYENADRVVKIVEKKSPAGYHGIETITIPVKRGEVNKDFELTGSSKLNVQVIDMTGNYLSGAHIKVESVKGNHLIKDFITANAEEEIIGTIAGSGYRITQIEAPQGYVKLKNSVKTVTSSISGETKETQIMELKATYQHKIKGTKIAVYNSKNQKVDEWIADGKEHNIENLNQYEKYTLREVEPVQGYYRNGDIEFTVKDKDVKLKATSYKTVIEVPSNISGNEFVVIDKKTETIADTWQKGARELRGLEKGHNYVLRQTKTAVGYVQAKDIEFTTEERDQTFEVKNSKVEIFAKDVDGKGIKGILISILDSEGNVVDSHISDGNVYQPNNLHAGQDYVVQEQTPAGGYVVSEDWLLSIDTKGTDYSHDLISNIQRVDNIDVEEDTIRGSVLEVVDEEGKSVDVWTTGQHILDIDEVAKKNLKEKGKVILKDTEIKTSVDKRIREHSLEMLVKGIEESLPILYPTKGDYSAETYFDMALERLPLTSEEKEKVLNEITKKVQNLKGETNKETADKLKEELKAYLNNLIDSKTNTETGYTTAEVIKKEDGYTVELTDKQGIMSYYDIDLNGDETTHRVKNMKDGKEYTIKARQSAGAYKNTENVSTKVNAESNDMITLISEPKIVLEPENSTPISPRTLVWSALSAVGMLVVGVYYKLAKRNKTTPY